FDRVAFGHWRGRQLGATHDFAIVLDGHRARVESEVREQGLERGGRRNPGLLAVQRNHNVRHASSIQGSSRANVAAAESSACQSARNAATPQAPASRTAAALAVVIPPMAITGIPACAAAVINSRPAAGRPGCEAVSNTFPAST